MKIIYKDNPLTSSVELDAIEKIKLLYDLKLKEMEELLWDVHFSLTEEHFNLERARKAADYKYFSGADDLKEGEKTPLEIRAEVMFNAIIEDLESGYHSGDCTCIPCTCMKCYGEDMIGINTLSGTSKHTNYKIDWAFDYGRTDVSIDVAIKKLENYDCIPNDPDSEHWKSKGGYEQFIPEWKKEYQYAADWLKKYKHEKLK